MSTIRISNGGGASALVYSYAISVEKEKSPIIVWLELAPDHPKQIGAIWASLVGGDKELIRIWDEDKGKTFTATGLNRRYIKITEEVPTVYARPRPRFTRLVAPEMVKPDGNIGNKTMYVAEWRGTTKNGKSVCLPPTKVLAALLENHSIYPIRLDWGEYLLEQAIEDGRAMPFQTGGPAPQGYTISADTPWRDYIEAGVRTSFLQLGGEK